VTPAIEEALRAHVDAAHGEPFVWGVNDCTRWAADWCEKIIGHSLELPEYRSEEEAVAMIASAGSLRDLWSNHLAIAGVHEVFEPRCGDVAIIDRAGVQIGAVMTHGGIALVRVQDPNGNAGVTFTRARRIAGIWRP
jgi:hypothetical protein